MADFAKGLCGGAAHPVRRAVWPPKRGKSRFDCHIACAQRVISGVVKDGGHLGRDRPCRRARSGRQGAQVPCAPVPATDPRPQPLTHLPTCLPLSHRLCLPTVIGRRAASRPVPARSGAVRPTAPARGCFRPPAGRPGRAAHSRGPKRFRCSFHRPSLRPVSCAIYR